MKSQLLTIRSIGAEFANRMFYPVLIVSLLITFAVTALIVWLTTISQWWLLLFIPVMIAACVAIGVLTITKLIIRTVTPIQSVVQKKATKKFVDKLQRLSDVTQTPKFILLFRIVRDIAAPQENGFIGTLAGDTSSLKDDFKKLNMLFNK